MTSRCTCVMQASRKVWPSELTGSSAASCLVTSETVPAAEATCSNCTRQVPHLPRPPHTDLIAIPDCHAANSKLLPSSTRTHRAPGSNVTAILCALLTAVVSGELPILETLDEVHAIFVASKQRFPGEDTRHQRRVRRIGNHRVHAMADRRHQESTVHQLA